MRTHAGRLTSLAGKVVCMIPALMILGPVAAHAQDLCQPRSDGAGRECFVSPSGNDASPGTIAAPFATIAKGVSVLQAGDVLSLRGGVYVEPVVVAGKHGTETQPIVIRSYPGEQASIEGSLPEFRALNNQDWERASLYDPDAHPDEYVSVTKLAAHVRGAFLDRNPYTRLITYSRLEDLRAENETFDTITDPSDPRPGPDVVSCNGEDGCAPAGYRHPWVYMGPGIWIDRSFSPEDPQRVHIRLSPTHNNVPGLADYTGEVDPRQVRLAISPEPMVTLRVQGSSHLRFERLSIRYGGDFTTILTGVTGLVFDHVQFLASSHGVRTGTNIGTTFEQSKSVYAPGFEANSIDADPQFEQIGADGLFRATDDLRLSATSPARAAGVTLPDDLLALDAEVVPPTGGAPDMGCCPHGSDPLLVGVDGRKSYPASSDPQAPAPSSADSLAVTEPGARETAPTVQAPAADATAAGATVSAAITRTVTSADDLVSVLESDYEGEIVIPGDAVFNLTGHRHLQIKAGVTLRSDRGGIRKGALIYTNDLVEERDENGDLQSYALFDVIGNDVRIEGLRFRGPSQSPTKTVPAFGIRIRSDRARRVVVLNNEFFGWTYAGVAVHGPISPRCPDDLPPGQGRDMDRWQAGEILIQRNYFHHNVMDGKGDGVNIKHGAYARIEANVFDYNRHAIASDGRPYTGYIARYNYVLQGGHKEGGTFGYYNQHFDMHGCNGNGTEAGEFIEIAYNTFRGEQEYAFGFKTRPAFWLRGTPSDAAWFVENVLVHDDFGEAIRYENEGERLYVEGNSFNIDHSLELGVGDFDGDGYDDAFVATGIGWYYSSLGVAPWQFITRSTKTLDEIGFGDFDGDGYTDILESYNDDWRYFSGREHKFNSLDHGSAFGISSFRFGDFDGNGKTDVLRANGTAWYVSWDARTTWDEINTSDHDINQLRLGDFNGDGKTDIFSVRNGEWSWSSGGQAPWAKLNDALVDSLDSLVFGDFDGDGRTDVAYESGSEWRFASGGQGASSQLRDSDADQYKSIKKPVIGRFIGESCNRCQSTSAQATARRDAFLRFEETPAPPLGSVIGVKLVAWVYGAPRDDEFFVVSRHPMR
ncbi:MAG: hypothetical protein GEU99_11840 [Luteitalea sp.]|nr:hypothetical protein [Luteitalea sp.]